MFNVGQWGTHQSCSPNSLGLPYTDRQEAYILTFPRMCCVGLCSSPMGFARALAAGQDPLELLFFMLACQESVCSASHSDYSKQSSPRPMQHEETHIFIILSHRYFRVPVTMAQPRYLDIDGDELTLLKSTMQITLSCDPPPRTSALC